MANLHPRPFLLRTAHLVLAFVIFHILPASAFSQWSGALGSSWNNPVSASISRILVDRINQRMLAKRLAAKRGGQPAPSNEKPSAAGITAERLNSTVTFRPTGTRLKVAEIVQTIGGSAAEQAQIRALLTGLLDAWDSESTKNGYKNDVALAFSGFIAMSSSAWHGTSPPPDAKIFELRDLIAELAAENSVFAQTTDRQKQEMYEVLVIFGSLAYSGYTQAKQTGDTASADLYRQLGGLNLQTVLGVKPDDIRFEPDGLLLTGASTEPQTPEPSSPAPRNGAAIHAGELVKAFEENEIRASSLYGGRRMLITGTLNSIEMLPNNRASLTFRSTITSYGMVKCFFERDQKGPLARFSTGETLTVEGKVKELGGGWDGAKAFVVVEACVVR